ncbi:MAG TPA: HEAT repeat domain-containing protein, partial [Planctomycetota bacterium]|nr:HEAT repeat domain-containing protein [Planctomycetota bacterium]
MTGTHRKLGLLLVLSSFAPVLTAAPSFAQDAGALFDQGVDLLSRGRDAEALEAFKKVLAADPSHEEAWEMFRRTENQVWMDILTKQGEFELVGRRLMGLAAMGRLERRDDAEAIRPLVAQLDANDPISRLSATRQLAAEHGEYAVTYMLPALADAGDEDRRVAVMQALTEMNLDVVLPLSAALHSSEAYLRRNVALTLGYIGDLRAIAPLAMLAQVDPDPGVKQAAGEALKRLGAPSADPVAAFVEMGRGYANRDGKLLSGSPDASALWRWGGQALEYTDLPKDVWPDAMGRLCFAHALHLAPDNAAALAGFVRCQVAAESKLALMAESGIDVGERLAEVQAGSVSVGLAGAAAADSALNAAVAARDVTAALGLVRAVAAMAATPTLGLQAALASDDGALRSSAAIALGSIAVDTRTAPGADVVNELARAAGREIVRIAFLIDPVAERANAVAGALRAQGMMVNVSSSAALGLGTLQRLPGVDVILVSDQLQDLTTFQVLADLSDDARFGETPRVLITDDGDAAGELYGDKVSGMVVGGDVSGVPGLLEGTLNQDRARADVLSRQAAATLADLAAGGADISSSLDALAGCLATRPDEVA